jgi:hypothetical protein
MSWWLLALEIVGFVGGIATFIGLMLAPMFYLGSKIDAVRTDLEAWKNESHLEIKDFHGKLCVLEERSKK